MDQCTICLYLNRNGFSAKAIHDELIQVLDSDAIAYSTVTSYPRASHWRAQNEEQHSDPRPDVIGNTILQALNQTTFASMRELAKSTCISRATVW
jgi:DNA-binding MurR/RpiR family transcriptional regulator